MVSGYPADFQIIFWERWPCEQGSAADQLKSCGDLRIYNVFLQSRHNYSLCRDELL